MAGICGQIPGRTGHRTRILLRLLRQVPRSLDRGEVNLFGSSGSLWASGRDFSRPWCPMPLAQGGQMRCRRSDGSLRGFWLSREQAEKFAQEPKNTSYHGDIVVGPCGMCGAFHCSLRRSAKVTHLCFLKMTHPKTGFGTGFESRGSHCRWAVGLRGLQQRFPFSRDVVRWVYEEADHSLCGSLNEGPSIRIVWQRCRRRLSMAWTRSLFAKMLCH